jgi:8-oxo-dGTP pyrophosphatase MutT (NUDIX family)
MLLFYGTRPSELLEIRQHGIRPTIKKRVHLFPTPRAARAAAGRGCFLLCIDTQTLTASTDEMLHKEDGRVLVDSVPASTIQNLDPYLPVREITAGGGYVICPSEHGPKVLLIFRRGVWDLPKGKLDRGETPEAGALREVKEEVGIEKLKIVRSLGTTRHGYVERGAYRVKTTYWYMMKTPERSFVPQKSEGIVKVAWKGWAKALKVIGYESLRRHMKAVEEKGYIRIE